MGRKESWFSAIKRAFTLHSKPESENKPRKEKKKKGFGRLRRGEKNSLLPIFREPSSIEKILGEVERDHNLVFRPISPVVISPQPVSPQPVYTQPVSPRTVSPGPLSPKPVSPRTVSSSSNYPRAVSPTAASQRVVSPKANSVQPVSTTHISQKPVSPGNVSSRPDYPKPVSPKLISQIPVSPGNVSSRHDYPEPVSPRLVSPKANSLGSNSQRAYRPEALSPRYVQRPKETAYRPEPTPADQHASVTKIQAAFRGYMARRNFRAGKGMLRLQEVMRGKHAKRQTKNALKHMQLLVRVQTQIQSRRIQMLQNGPLEKEIVSGKSGTREARNGNWDASVLTKEEKDARLRRKADATIMRERSMAYAYHPQLLKSSSQSELSNSHSAASPLWLHWVDWQLPKATTPPPQPQTPKHLLTPPRENHFRFDNNSQTSTPNSPIPRAIRTPPSYTHSRMSRFSGARTEDDSDSLMSCPPSISRHYMTPTASARAKARTSSHPRERPVAADGSKRRLSYPLVKGRNTGSSALGSPRGSVRSLGNLSVVSTASTTVARKPFNRFV